MPLPSYPFPSREATQDVSGQHLSKTKVEVYRQLGLDVVMGKREGAYFEDAFNDQRFFNCHCNGGVFNLGHRNPRVLAAVRQALDHVDIGNHHFVSGYRAALAARLAATTEGRLPGVVFGVSGGEAIDLAIKIARGVTGRRNVISAVGGYHGHTGLALATGDAQYRDPFGTNLPGFSQVPFNDVQALEQAVDADTAVVIMEAIPATLGMPIPAQGYFRAVQELCRRRGARLIIDEVQTGLGRTGRTWCYQHEGIEPDAVVTGKGLSGGIYPITATLLSSEMHTFIDQHPFVHISTFGGAEPGCAAANAVLDIIGEPGFLARVTQLSDRLAEGMRGLPFELRRRGLMMALKFPDQGDGLMAARKLYEAGVFCTWANNDSSVTQFLPPLIISDAEAGELLARVKRAFS